MDTPATRAVRKARTSLLTGKPQGRGAFFGALAMRLDLVEDPKLKELMSTNGRVLKFNPEMVKATSPEHLMSVVAHEVIHLSSGHHVRRGRRDPKLWNIAVDHFTNLELKDAGFPLPGEVYADPRFKGMAAERIYTILESEQPPSNQQGQGKGEGQGQSGQQKGGQPQWSGGVEDSPGDGGKQDGDGEDEDGDGQGDGLSEEEIQAEQREWEMATIQAAAAAQQMGNLPSFAERFLSEITKPKVNPWEILREHCKQTMQSDYRWFPPGRRLISQGYYFPSVRSDDAMGEMVVVIDTSGSIDAKTLQEFGNHISAIKEDFSPLKIHVVYADAAVNHVDVFERDDPLVIKPHGGGGTDFRPAFKFVEKNEIDPVVLVYLTDLYGVLPSSPVSYPVIWACTTDQKAAWGETIHIKV